MRGFILAQFVEFVERRFGKEVIDDLIEQTPLASGGVYTAVDSYDTAEIVALVSGLSEKVTTPVPTLLREFGISLFDYLAESHAILLRQIDQPFALFEKLDSYIHAEVRRFYDDAVPPAFQTEHLEGDTLRLEYRSSRAMPDLAEGLIVGACRYFGREAEIRREDRSDGSGVVVDFFVRLNET